MKGVLKMKRSLLSGVLLLSLFCVPQLVMANPTVELDLNPATQATDDSLVVSKGETFETYLYIRGVTDMTGVSVDMTFPAAEALDLVAIKEVVGDLNFDGSLSLDKEVLPVINQFVDEFNFVVDDNTNFQDGYERNSAVVFDTNGNTLTDLDTEVLPMINEFVDEFNFAEIPYWTRTVLFTSDFDESVEIFDPVAKSNVGGAGEGTIDDITAVLLKRPDRPVGDAFGFSGDALIAKIIFKARANATADTYSFDFPQRKWIDKDFTGLGDIIGEDDAADGIALPSPLPQITVQD